MGYTGMPTTPQAKQQVYLKYYPLLNRLHNKHSTNAVFVQQTGRTTGIYTIQHLQQASPQYHPFTTGTSTMPTFYNRHLQNTNLLQQASPQYQPSTTVINTKPTFYNRHLHKTNLLQQASPQYQPSKTGISTLPTF